MEQTMEKLNTYKEVLIPNLDRLCSNLLGFVPLFVSFFLVGMILIYFLGRSVSEIQTSEPDEKDDNEKRENKPDNSKADKVRLKK